MKKQILFIPFTLIILSLWVSSCKEDCVKGVVLKQRYKIYQSWYPYQELDTLHFYRLPENDTLVFYGSKYTYPYYVGVGGCDCCNDEKIEYLQQTFYSEDKKSNFRVEMDGRNIKFRVNGRWEYEYDFGGHALLRSEVTTPDSIYEWAYKLDDAGHSCYYATKVGIVKYAYDNNGIWLFLRKK
jgi:hypothetical protein